MKIIQEQELRDLLKPLSAEERSVLKQSIQEEGLRDPIIVWVREQGIGTILDGHNRFEICQDLGIPPKLRILNPSPATIEGAKLWMLTLQLGRRNVTDDMRRALAAQMYELQAQCRRAEQAKAARLGQKGLGVNESLRSQVAKQAGVTDRQLRSAIELQNEAPDLNQKVATGQMTMRQANAELRERNEDLEPTKVEKREDFGTHGGALPSTNSPDSTDYCAPVEPERISSQGREPEGF